MNQVSIAYNNIKNQRKKRDMELKTTWPIFIFTSLYFSD